MQTEQLLCWRWSGMTDSEHSTTPGSNEEEGNTCVPTLRD